MVDTHDDITVLVNTRSPEQWEIISPHIDWVGKRVLDLGCGHCDLLAKCKEAGANVLGVDLQPTQTAKDRGIPVLPMSIQDYLTRRPSRFDVVLCFSVLPYIQDPEWVLDGMRDIADVALIECQLVGDGPGIWTEIDVWQRLWERWEKVKKLGHTIVEGRNTKRHIWMCEAAKGGRGQ